MKMKLINAINYYRQHGLLQFIKRFFERLGFECFNRTLIFLKLDLNNILHDFKESHSFLIASKDDIQKEQNYYDGWFKKKEAIYRLQNGHRLFVLKENERMVYFQWGELKKATIAWFDLHFHIPQDMVYSTGIYVLPELSKKGIASKIGKEILHYLKKEGFNHIFLVIDPSNIASLKLNKKLGFKEYQTVHYKRYWFIRYFCVNKYNSNQQKTFITVFKTPEIIWKVFL